MNLTAIRDPEAMVTRHFGESFFAAKTLSVQGPARSVTDLGSGAGFPGIPMAMLMPEAQVTLIEAQGKKATFLREVIFTLGLKNAVVYAGRGEAFKDRADLVTMRAVEDFEKALPTAVGLVETGGRIALMIGAGQSAVAEKFRAEVEWQPPIAVPGGHSRILLVGTKAVKVER